MWRVGEGGEGPQVGHASVLDFDPHRITNANIATAIFGLRVNLEIGQVRHAGGVPGDHVRTFDARADREAFAGAASSTGEGTNAGDGFVVLGGDLDGHGAGDDGIAGGAGDAGAGFLGVGGIGAGDQGQEQGGEGCEARQPRVGSGWIWVGEWLHEG